MAHPTVPVKLKMMRMGFAMLGLLAPPLAVAWAYKIWFRSPRYRAPKREITWQKQSRQVFIHTRYGKVMTYHWGKSEQPCVFLVHGWSGRGLQLAAFAAPLVQAGYSVTSFDAPGHGQSVGESTSIFQIAEVLRQLVRESQHPHAIIAHSFGCMVSAYAIHHFQLAIPKLITISSPTIPQYLIEGFVELFQFNTRITDGFIGELKKEFGEDVLERIAADNNLRDWPGELMVIHDKDDAIVHWQYSQLLEKVASKCTTLYTDSLGHRRILGNQGVISAVVDFIKESNYE